jgi:hypothetical protein
METKYTPGPWKAELGNRSNVWIVHYPLGPLAVIGFGGTKPIDGTNEANARLIAAAPELVEALRPFAACAEVWEGDDPDWILHRSRQNVPGKPNLHITVGDLLAARAALARVGGDDWEYTDEAKEFGR